MTTLDPEPIVLDVTDQLKGRRIKSAQFVDFEGGDRISLLEITFYNGNKLVIQPDTSDSALTGYIEKESGVVELV